MTAIWRTVRNYILWSYERGTIHYDVMVTLILIFILFSPRWINFNDKPVERNPHRSEVVITPDGRGGLIYQVSGSAIASPENSSPSDDRQLRSALLRVIEPISGEVSITRIEPVLDRGGRVLNYKVWVEKQ
ncbi:MAG: hypothetical protein M3O09_10175 [Acidobacteriota bacterium]|nr:hypothetical protein [Acidobacteriota bacterium]